MKGYKILTHDFRPPIQGGRPIWDGVTLPFELPRRKLDLSTAECAPGWNFVRDLATGFQIAGLWPDGRPSVAVRVEVVGDHVERGNKCRAAGLRIVGICSDRTIHKALAQFSAPLGSHAKQMTRSQMAWRRALARPLRDESTIEAGLATVLRVRGLDWNLKRYKAAWAARDAWAARAAWDAWAARDAWAALSAEFASLMGWDQHGPYVLTTGLREAYRHGLETALPTGPHELGWAMA